MKVIRSRRYARLLSIHFNYALIPRVLLLTILIQLSGCQESETPKPAAPPPPVVEITTVQQKDIPIKNELVVTLDGMVNAQILAQVTGYLIKQNYKDGNPVKKGQLLYEIDPRVFQAALIGAKGNLVRQEAQLKVARLDLERIKRLLPENAVSVRDRDIAVGREATAKAEVVAAQAAVEKAKLELGFTKVYSPIDGVGGISKAQLGDLVGPNSANATLTTVSQINPIKAYANISEQQYLRFVKADKEEQDEQTRQAIELILADGSIYPYPGKFLFVDRQIDVVTGTIRAVFEFPNPFVHDYILRPGQFAKIRFTSQNQQNALIVPQRALFEVQGNWLVAVVKPDNTVDFRTVKPGVVVDANWIIDEGLQAGEQVIVEGFQKVRSGMKVDAKPFHNAQTPVEK